MVSKNRILKYCSIFENRLEMGGRPVAEWIHENRSPAYLYDADVIRQKISLFRTSMPGDICLYYAVKANPNPELIQRIAPLVEGFDVASEGEMNRVVSAGGDPGTISFAGPGKSEKELLAAVKAGIGSINLESRQELDKVTEIGDSLGVKPNVSIRINPDFELRGAGMRMGGGPKQFGIDAEAVPKVLEQAASSPKVSFKGLHIYCGSQNLKVDTMREVLEKTLELMWRIGASYAKEITLLNLGGGFGIPYSSNDTELEIGAVGQRLKELMEVYRPRFPNARFVIELGRYLVGECGIYVTRILYRKASRGQIFLITDGGMNHHLAASGNFGQVLRKNYPIVNADRISGQEIEKVNIVGPLCTPLDLLGAQVELPVSREGDLIAILNSGAYGFSASPIQFLGHEAPPEILCELSDPSAG